MSKFNRAVITKVKVLYSIGIIINTPCIKASNPGKGKKKTINMFLYKFVFSNLNNYFTTPLMKLIKATITYKL